MKRFLIAFICIGSGAALAAVEGCGSDDATLFPTDAASDSPVVGDVDLPDSGDAAPIVDAGIPCAPPSDPQKSSICIVVTPEAIQFLNGDPDLDGKGFGVIEVQSGPNPDLPDGGQVTPLGTSTFGVGDAGEFDLASPIPMVRFDGLPAKVYPRVLFVDVKAPGKQPGPGWWIGGYDLSKGFVQPQLLMPVTLQPGKGTTVTVDLVALRKWNVTVTRSATPVGNAMGVANVLAMTDKVPTSTSSLFGVATNQCANVSGNKKALANGFVIGKGPYYAVALLDDYGTGSFLAPGSLTSLEVADGGLQNPAAAQMVYPATAYLIARTVDLGLVVPKPSPGVDSVACP